MIAPESDSSDLRQAQAPVLAAALPKPVKADASTSIAFVSWMCFVTAVCTLLIGFFCLKYLKNQNSDMLGFGAGASQYVFVDMEAIYALKLKQAMNRPGMSMEKAEEEASTFKNSVDKEVSRLADNGNIVLTKQAVLAGGSSLDVTEQLAVSLGLKP